MRLNTFEDKSSSTKHLSFQSIMVAGSRTPIELEHVRSKLKQIEAEAIGWRYFDVAAGQRFSHANSSINGWSPKNVRIGR